MVRAKAVRRGQRSDRTCTGRRVQYRTVFTGGAGLSGKAGCILVVDRERRLVWTDGLGPRFRPNAELFMTAEITMEPVADGTLYRALVRHKSAEDRAKHEGMGFFRGGASV